MNVFMFATFLVGRRGVEVPFSSRWPTCCADFRRFGSSLRRFNRRARVGRPWLLRMIFMMNVSELREALGIDASPAKTERPTR
jgi:hypothetical protein